MAKVEIYWTKEAEIWLKDIYDFIAQDSPDSAQKVINGIFKKVQILSTFPEIGHLYDARSEDNVRILLYGHYRIAYLIKDNKTIDILGIFHGSLDIEKYLI